MLLAGLVVVSNLSLRPAPAPLVPQLAVPIQPVQAVLPVRAAGLLAVDAAVRRLQVVDTGGVAVKASLDGLWEGEREQGGEEAFAYVPRQEGRLEARQQMRAQFPPLDQRAQAFSAEGAREFAESEFDLGGLAMTGRQVLSLLVTPYAIVDGFAPDPRTSDFAGFGRGETELRALADERGFSVHRLYEVLRLAHRDGLVYRLHETLRGRTYYGVTYQARAALGLREAPSPGAAAEPAANAAPGEFSARLAAVTDAAADLPPKDELVEFVSDVVAALETDPSRLETAVLTLLESAHGTRLWEAALALAQAGAAQGLVSRTELEQVLKDL